MKMNIIDAAQWELEELKKLIQVDPEIVNERDEKGETLFTYACRYGSLENVEFLVSNGGDVRHKSKNGFTPFIHAADTGNLEVVEFLLKNGADVKDESENGETALMVAATNGRIEVVKYLIKIGAAINHIDLQKCSILMCAATAGNASVVKVLGENGADTEYPNKDGKRAIDLAADKGHAKVVEVLENEETIRKLRFCPPSDLFKDLRSKIRQEQNPEELKDSKLAIVDALRKLEHQHYFNDSGEIYRLYLDFKEDSSEFKSVVNISKSNTSGDSFSIRYIDNFIRTAPTLVRNYFNQKYSNRKPKPRASYCERFDIHLKPHHRASSRNYFRAAIKYRNPQIKGNSFARGASGI